MKYFAVQVRTNHEDVYIEQVNTKLEFRHDKQTFIFLKRKLSIRKAGKNTIQILPVFPGYIFIEAEEIDPLLYNIAKHTPSFNRFLVNNKDIRALEGRDLTILTHFMNFGTVAETSKVWFDDNDRIVVSSGPLQGIEGCIIKVDKRKKRAKVKLDFANNNFTLDLAFEILNKNNKSGLQDNLDSANTLETQNASK